MLVQFESRRILILIFASLILLLSHRGGALAADAINPLTPADTISPRATLNGFVEAVNTGHAQLKEILKSYLSSSRLYLSAEERVEVDRLHENVALARRTLNLSELPAALTQTESLSRTRSTSTILHAVRYSRDELR